MNIVYFYLLYRYGGVVRPDIVTCPGFVEQHSTPTMVRGGPPPTYQQATQPKADYKLVNHSVHYYKLVKHSVHYYKSVNHSVHYYKSVNHSVHYSGNNRFCTCFHKNFLQRTLLELSKSADILIITSRNYSNRPTCNWPFPVGHIHLTQ